MTVHPNMATSVCGGWSLAVLPLRLSLLHEGRHALLPIISAEGGVEQLFLVLHT